jgi:hypothetical protein
MTPPLSIRDLAVVALAELRRWYPDESLGDQLTDQVQAALASDLLPDLTPGNVDRNGELAERLDDLPVEDVLRILVASAHSIWHRAPTRLDHDTLVTELRTGIDDVHAVGLP